MVLGSSIYFSPLFAPGVSKLKYSCCKEARIVQSTSRLEAMFRSNLEALPDIGYPTDSELAPRDFKTEQFGIVPTRIP
jgi:hypothetical protein